MNNIISKYKTISAYLFLIGYISFIALTIAHKHNGRSHSFEKVSSCQITFSVGVQQTVTEDEDACQICNFSSLISHDFIQQNCNTLFPVIGNSPDYHYSTTNTVFFASNPLRGPPLESNI